MTTNMTTKRELNIDALNMVAGGEEYRNHVMYGDCEIWTNCDSSAVYGADDGTAVEYNGPLYSADGTANGPLYTTPVGAKWGIAERNLADAGLTSGFNNKI